MKKLISLLLAILLACSIAFAETDADRAMTSDEQAYNIYLDIAHVHEYGVRYMEELGRIWKIAMDAKDVAAVNNFCYMDCLTKDPLSSIYAMHLSKDGFSVEDLRMISYSRDVFSVSEKTDLVWVVLDLEMEAKYIESPEVLKTYLDRAMKNIRTLMASDREYPFLSDLQEYYKEAVMLNDYITVFNDNYTNFSVKLEAFRTNKSSREIDFEFIFDLSGYEYVNIVRENELQKEYERIYNQALALENSGDYAGAIDLYWQCVDYSDAYDRMEACRNHSTESLYQEALEHEGKKEYKEALEIYEGLNGYKDSAERIESCKYNLLPFQQVFAFSEGLAAVKKDGKWGYINTSGDIVIPCQFESVTSFSCELASIFKDGKSGYINTDGEIVIPCEWDDAYPFTEGYTVVKNSAYSGLIDTNGNKITVPGEWDKVWLYSDGLVQVKKDGKWGYATLEGDIVIDCVWDTVSMFSEGMAAVSKDNKYGYIDTKGNEVIPCQWDYAFSFNSGIACVRNSDNKCGYIDYSGNIVHPFGAFDSQGFKEGIFCGNIRGKAGCYDIKGNEIIQSVYDMASYGEGYFILLKNGKLTILPREEVQPNWKTDLEAYEAELKSKREAIATEAEKQKMLTEYTDKETVKAVQAALNEAGFPCGTPDGAAGKKTIAALTDYQTAKDLTVTGTITHETLISMGLK